MRFQEDIRIISAIDIGETPYVHLRKRPINLLIKALEERGFSLDEDMSQVGYNSRGIPIETLSIPLRLWKKISLEEGVTLYCVDFTGINRLVENENTFKLSLKDDRGVDDKDERYFNDEIKGFVLLTTDHEKDYDKALSAMRDMGELIRSVYKK